MKEIEIEGVLNVPVGETQDSVNDKFIKWVESQGWEFGGAIKELP